MEPRSNLEGKMEITNEDLKQLQQTVPEVVWPQVEKKIANLEKDLTSDEAIEIASYAVTLILIELAAQLAANEQLQNAVTYHITKNNESSLPDNVVDSVAGWLMAPRSTNPLHGKVTKNYHFNVYGMNHNE